MVYDERYNVIGLYTCDNPELGAIQPSKAMCNLYNHKEFNEEDEKKLDSHNFEFEKISCLVKHDKIKYVYVNFSDTEVDFDRDGKKGKFKYNWPRLVF